MENFCSPVLEGELFDSICPDMVRKVSGGSRSMERFKNAV